MLAPVAGSKLADLLQSQDEFEDVLDRGRVAQFGQSHDAFLLGQPIALALFGRQVERLVVDQFGRQVAEDLILRAPQHVVANASAHAARLSSRGDNTPGARNSKIPNRSSALFSTGGAG